MGATNEQGTRAIFYKILDADGTFRENSDASCEEAVKRIVQKKDGSTIAIYEKVYTKITGFLKSISVKEVSFKSGNSMMVANIRLSDPNPIEPDMIISIPYESNFFSYFIERAPNIPPNTLLNFKPFSFTKDGRTNKGINIFISGGEKIASFFKADGVYINGHPDIKEGEKTKNYWKFFFAESRDYMWKYYLENVSVNFGDLSKQEREDIEREAKAKEAAAKPSTSNFEQNNNPIPGQASFFDGASDDIPFDGDDLPF